MFPFEACEENRVYDPVTEKPQPIDIVASYTLTEHERAACRIRLKRFTTHDGRYEDLRKALLSTGGLDVLIQRDDHLGDVIDKGEVWTDSTKTTDGDRHASHLNAAELYEEGAIDAIGHGWALSTKTGLWYRHTWGIVDDASTVVETTDTERAAYYGIPLRGAIETEAYAVNLQMEEVQQSD